MNSDYVDVVFDMVVVCSSAGGFCHGWDCNDGKCSVNAVILQ